MEELDAIENKPAASVTKFAWAAVVFALVGLSDSVYLTVQHFTDEKVPCSIITGCEQVLTSEYAEISGIPTAAFGAIAYFLVFALALLAAFGNRRLWFFYGLLVGLMFLFTMWLVYLQAFVIEAFCQFCLLSALTTTALFVIALVSKFWTYK
ncbi:MAG: vitamin K epoxide reductase family protein [Pyrinomonadaceae bacterium]